MKERPILFSGEMVRAILDGRKTQTRRVIKPQPVYIPQAAIGLSWGWKDTPGGKKAKVFGFHDQSEFDRELSKYCPYGVPGDLLWVRETWAGNDMCGVVYRADHPNADISKGDLDDGEQQLRFWRPSIHMPRWASRITLRVVDVRVERVQEISAENAIAEGCRDTKPHDPLWDCTALQDFCTLWDSINASRGFGWDANPFCWVVSFERVTP